MSAGYPSLSSRVLPKIPLHHNNLPTFIAQLPLARCDGTSIVKYSKLFSSTSSCKSPPARVVASSTSAGRSRLAKSLAQTTLQHSSAVVQPSGFFSCLVKRNVELQDDTFVIQEVSICEASLQALAVSTAADGEEPRCQLANKYWVLATGVPAQDASNISKSAVDAR